MTNTDCLAAKVHRLKAVLIGELGGNCRAAPWDVGCKGSEEKCSHVWQLMKHI